MFKQPTKHHNCAMCGVHCQTKDNGPCVSCKERIDGQIDRYKDIAERFAVSMEVDFVIFRPVGGSNVHH